MPSNGGRMPYLTLFGINFLLLYRSLKCGICIDDDARIDYMSQMKKRGLLTSGWIHFLRHATYGAGVFKDSFTDHLFTLLLNGVNVMLVYKVTGSFLVSLLWLFNPINNQLSIWMNGRRYALSMMFVLIGLIFKPIFLPLYLIAIWLHVISAPAIILLLGTKYIFLFPAALFAFKMFGYKRFKDQLLNRKKAFSKTNELQKITPKKIIIYIKSMGYNFVNTLMPIPRMYNQHLYYFSRYEWSIKKGYSLNKEFWKGAIVCLFLAYEVLICQNIWALWFVLFISQWNGICTVTMNAADRYCTLPAIGLMMVLNKYITYLPYEYQIIAYTSIMTVYVMKYNRLFKAYQTKETFWRYHIEIQPDCPDSRSLYAQKVMHREPEKAFTLIKDGLKYRPKDFKLLINMVQCLLRVGRNKEALEVLKIVEPLVPLGEEQDSVEEFEKLRESLKPVPKPNRKQRRANKKV